MKQEPLLKGKEEKIVFGNSNNKKINKKLTIWAILKLIPLIIFLGIAVYYTIRGVNCSSSLVGYKKCDFLSGMLLILKLCFPFAIASLILFISGIIDLVKNYKK